MLHHLDTGWQLRHAPNVVMCHYADYSTELPGEIVRLANALDINMTADRAQALAAEATLERMRDRADDVLPNAGRSGRTTERSFELAVSASGAPG